MVLEFSDVKNIWQSQGSQNIVGNQLYATELNSEFLNLIKHSEIDMPFSLDTINTTTLTGTEPQTTVLTQDSQHVKSLLYFNLALLQ
jgi:hypothetical protein